MERDHDRPEPSPCSLVVSCPPKGMPFAKALLLRLLLTAARCDLAFGILPRASITSSRRSMRKRRVAWWWRRWCRRKPDEGEGFRFQRETAGAAAGIGGQD